MLLLLINFTLWACRDCQKQIALSTNMIRVWAEITREYVKDKSTEFTRRHKREHIRGQVLSVRHLSVMFSMLLCVMLTNHIVLKNG